MNEDTRTIKDIEVLVDSLLAVIEQQAKTIDQLIKLKTDLKEQREQYQEDQKKGRDIK